MKTNLNGITDMLESFLSFRKAQNASPRTLERYRNDSKHFITFLADHSISSFKDVTQQTLKDYRIHLLNNRFKPTTLKGMLCTIRRLFAYFEDQCLLFENPTTNFKGPTLKRTLPDVITVEEVDQLINLPDCTTPMGIRDRAALELAYSTAVRNGELCNLRITDIDINNATVRVLGKGQKERLLPIGKSAMTYLKAYLQSARPKLLTKAKASDRHLLWLNMNHQAFNSRSFFTRIIRRYTSKGQFPRRITAYTLRRSCATHMLRNGAHPAMVANLLGHSDLHSLSYYLNVSITDIKNMHKNSKLGK